MGFTLSKKSLRNLEAPKVHPDIARVTLRAAELCDQPFEVFEGRRTLARQRLYVKRGVSKTLRSRHLVGMAVDNVPLIGGKLLWSQPACIEIADAMKAAAGELGIALRWGGDWDRDDDWRDERFFDGPHFELEQVVYPDDLDPRVTGGGKPAPQPSASAQKAALATMVLGDRGAPVIKLQSDLSDVGFALKADGYFGPKTYAAVRAYQERCQLVVDGIVGPKTLRQLARDSRDARKIKPL